MYTSEYEYFLFLGDFNAGIEDTSRKKFCNSFNPPSIVNMPTCYKNSNKLSCIDLTLSNHPRSIQNSYVIETGLSDFHRMVLTVMKISYQKLSPKIIKYRDYRYFSNDRFRESLFQGISRINMHFKSFLSNCNNTFLPTYQSFNVQNLHGRVGRRHVVPTFFGLIALLHTALLLGSPLLRFNDFVSA